MYLSFVVVKRTMMRRGMQKCFGNSTRLLKRQEGRPTAKDRLFFTERSSEQAGPYRRSTNQGSPATVPAILWLKSGTTSTEKPKSARTMASRLDESPSLFLDPFCNRAISMACTISPLRPVCEFEWCVLVLFSPTIRTR